MSNSRIKGKTYRGIPLRFRTSPPKMGKAKRLAEQAQEVGK